MSADTDTGVSAYPTGYTDNQTVTQSGAGSGDGATMITCTKTALASTDDDPVNLTLSSSVNFIGVTLALRGPVKPNHLGFMRFFNQTGSAVSTPDAAALDITGDLDVRALFLVDETGGQGASRHQNIITKGDPGNAAGSWALRQGGGSTSFQLSWREAGGTIRTATGNSGIIGRGFYQWIRAVLDVDNGAGQYAVHFYTSTESAALNPDSVTWNLINTVTGATGTSSINAGSADVFLGNRSDGNNERLSGDIMYAEIRNGIAGSKVAAVDFRDRSQYVHDREANDTFRTWTITDPAMWYVRAEGAALSAVGKAVQALWDIYTALGDTSTLRWDNQAALGDTSTLRWDILTPISDTIQALWDVRKLTPTDGATPVVQSRTSSSDNTLTSTHTVSLPSGITAGDLLFLAFSVSQSTSVTLPDGWVDLGGGASSVTLQLTIAYKIADGTEGSTMTVNTGTTRKSAHIVYRITGQGAIAPQRSALATGNNANPDPASLAPTGGSKNYLWLAVAAIDSSGSATAYPTDYVNGTTRVSSGGGASENSGIGVAERAFTSASEDPGTFTFNLSDAWYAFTVAIHPADTKNLNLRWDVLAPLADNNVLRWDAFSVLSDSIQLVWDVEAGLTAVGDTVQLVWDLREAIGNTNILRWDIRTALGDNAQLVWDIRTALGDTITLRWDQHTTIGDTIQSLWDVRAALGDTTTLRWDNRFALGDTVALVWDIRTPLGDTVALRWDITGAVGDQTVLQWDYRAAVGKAAQLVWDLFTPIGDTASLLWDLRFALGDTATLQWDISGAVGKQFQALWDIYTALGDSVELEWDVFELGAVGDEVQLLWDLRSTIGDTTQLLWDISGAVGDQVTQQWDVRTAQGDSIELLWDLATSLGNTAALQWNVHMTVGDTIALVWNVLRDYVYLRPVATVSNDGWDSGPTTGLPLWDQIDEATADDDDYITNAV